MAESPIKRAPIPATNLRNWKHARTTKQRCTSYVYVQTRRPGSGGANHPKANDRPRTHSVCRVGGRRRAKAAPSAVIPNAKKKTICDIWGPRRQQQEWIADPYGHWEYTNVQAVCILSDEVEIEVSECLFPFTVVGS
jgi:hypothetical protein